MTKEKKKDVARKLPENSGGPLAAAWGHHSGLC